jgi:hypothetical protein
VGATAEARWQEDIAEELGEIESSAEYRGAGAVSSDELNNTDAVTQEIVLIYNTLRMFRDETIPTGFGAYYHKLGLTDLLASKEWSSLWDYFTPQSIVLTFGELELFLADVKQQEINKHVK